VHWQKQSLLNLVSLFEFYGCSAVRIDDRPYNDCETNITSVSVDPILTFYGYKCLKFRETECYCRVEQHFSKAPTIKAIASCRDEHKFFQRIVVLGADTTDDICQFFIGLVRYSGTCVIVANAPQPVQAVSVNWQGGRASQLRDTR
jgi:hypothetical protein